MGAAGDANRLNKLVRKAGSVCPVSLEEVAGGRLRSRIRNILVNPSHLLHEEMNGLRGVLSSSLIFPICLKERFLFTKILFHSATFPPDTGWSPLIDCTLPYCL